MLRVENLTVKYAKSLQASVDNLSFHFKKGIICGFLGPNGAGKTSTLSVVCGLNDIYTGNIFIHDIHTRSNKKNILSKIGFAPQHIALYEQLTLLENLKYFGQMYQIEKQKLNSNIEKYVNLFGLNDSISKKIAHFSGGMKRRANIIAALLHDPQLLILDEPTAGVDVHSRRMILDFLIAYNASDNSIIYTSHLLNEAESICNEILIIDYGKKLIQGNPHDLIKLYKTENLEQLFIKLTGKDVRD